MLTLEDITEEDARAEGAEHWLYGHGPVVPSDGEWSHRGYQDGFMHAWDAINGKRSFGWDTNPYVWWLSFRRVEEQGS